MTTTWIEISLATATGVFAILARYWPLRPPTPDETMDPTVWPAGWPHDAPEQPFTLIGALMALQLHRGCPDTCARKTTATQTLRDAHIFSTVMR